MRVLIAVEDKNFGKTILDYILKNRWEAGTSFKVLHIIEPYELDEDLEITYLPFLEDTKKQVREMADLLVESLVERLKNELGSCSIESAVVEGNAKEKLLEEAESWKADLLCLGTHGRKGMGRFLLGSVSQAVAAHAPCAVLIVRKAAEKKKEARK